MAAPKVRHTADDDAGLVQRTRAGAGDLFPSSEAPTEWRAPTEFGSANVTEEGPGEAVELGSALNRLELFKGRY